MSVKFFAQYYLSIWCSISSYADQWCIHFEGSSEGPPVGNCSTGLLRQRREKSPAPSRNLTHDLWVAGRALYRCATTAPLAAKSKKVSKNGTEFKSQFFWLHSISFGTRRVGISFSLRCWNWSRFDFDPFWSSSIKFYHQLRYLLNPSKMIVGWSSRWYALAA